jgi:imidazolonepropionase-like amidohydrolase
MQQAPTWGLQEAVQRGLFEGPRLFIAGFPISQTGGHADMRPRGVRSGMFCSCADWGWSAPSPTVSVRSAVRCASRCARAPIRSRSWPAVVCRAPSDPIDGTQFSMDELRAAVEEAEAANLYALAHAYSPRAVSRAVQAGVRSIEHGNLIDEATVRLMKSHGTYLVPTLATYAALADEGFGWAGRPPCSTSSRVCTTRAWKRSVWRRPRVYPSSSAPTCWGTCTRGSPRSSCFAAAPSRR